MQICSQQICAGIQFTGMRKTFAILGFWVPAPGTRQSAKRIPAGTTRQECGKLFVTISLVEKAKAFSLQPQLRSAIALALPDLPW